MAEVELERLVDWVMAAVRGKDFVPARFHYGPGADAAAKTANDNDPDWPPIPFPEGWNGSC